MARNRSPFALASELFAECCKIDLPEVEAAIELLTPELAGFWVLTIDEAMRRYEEGARRGGDEELLLAALFAFLEVETRLGVPVSVSRNISEALSSIWGSAARRNRVPLDPAVTGALLRPAELDLANLMAGRATSRRPRVKQAAGRLHRAVRGTPVPEDPQAVPGRVRAARANLAEVLGRQTTRWVDFGVDLWGFRWFNIGTFALARRAGAVAFEADAIRDGRTTKFCIWVDGRIVEVEKLERQMQATIEAAESGDIEASMKAWPLLNRPNVGDDDTWETFFARDDVGFPPYHGRCRTAIRVLRIEV